MKPTSETDTDFTHVQHAMIKLAKTLRSAAYWSGDPYYDDDTAKAVNRAKQETLEEIASAIDTAFDVDSSLTAEDRKR